MIHSASNTFSELFSFSSFSFLPTNAVYLNAAYFAHANKSNHLVKMRLQNRMQFKLRMSVIQRAAMLGHCSGSQQNPLASKTH